MTNELIELFRSIRIAAFDFDGVFTDNFVYVDQRGTESVRCSRLDGIGLSRLKNLGVYPVIISTETNIVVTTRSKKLKVDCFQSVNDKAKAVMHISQTQGISVENIMFVGNDVNDLAALNIVGLPVAVADAQADVLQHVKYTTKMKGGYGAVRELCDLIATAKGTL